MYIVLEYLVLVSEIYEYLKGKIVCRAPVHVVQSTLSSHWTYLGIARRPSPARASAISILEPSRFPPPLRLEITFVRVSGSTLSTPRVEVSCFEEMRWDETRVESREARGDKERRVVTVRTFMRKV